MTVSLDSFVTSYPEFKEISCSDSALLEAKLAEATRFVSTCAFDALSDDAVMAKAAELLALSPCGRRAGMTDKKGNTGYTQIFDALLMTVIMERVI